MPRLITLGAVLLLLAVLIAGCGVGSTDEGKISGAADAYLRSLADGDVVGACEQLTDEARSILDGGCEPEMRRIAARVGSDSLEAAADGVLDVEVDGTTGSAVVRELDARLTLVVAGDDWRISHGHRLDSR
jgi:hypothetical protein